jgi:hypothetical protein
LRRESKFKPEEFIDTLMFSDPDHSQLSLQDCCNDLAQQHQRSLSKVALHKRFNSRSLDFLKKVLAQQMALKLDIEPGSNWAPFSRVLIVDSSKFAMPKQYMDAYPGFGGARGLSAMMNIQYCFDLKNGDWENLELTKATANDQSYSKKTLDRIGEGELHIRDLGYVTTGYMAKIVSKQSFFLNRLHPHLVPVQCNTGKPISWATLYQKMQQNKNTLMETMVRIGKGTAAFECRLIAVPVPEQVWAERIRKAQKQAKSHNSILSDEYKVRCRFSLFITNTTNDVLKAADIIQLYRLRWQIELIFKAWKSILDIHKVKAVKKERLECQLIAKFIWILLNWKIFRCIDAFIHKNSADYACSILKFYKQAKRYSQALRKVATGVVNFCYWCETFLCPIITSMLIEDKKGKKSAYMIVNDIFNP